jgi:hypothetical protein
MCSVKLPVEILDQIDRYWHGGDVSKKGGYLVAWKRVCRSKDDGGLGIINLRNHNTALLLKFLHKFYNKLDLLNKLYATRKPPHVRKYVGSLWRDVMSFQASSLWPLVKLTVVYLWLSGMIHGIWGG